MEVSKIDVGVLQALKQPTVLVVKSASGDEEIAGCGDLLQGVVLKQSLPHLSHLGKATSLCMLADTKLGSIAIVQSFSETWL